MIYNAITWVVPNSLVDSSHCILILWFDLLLHWIGFLLHFSKQFFVSFLCVIDLMILNLLICILIWIKPVFGMLFHMNFTRLCRVHSLLKALLYSLTTSADICNVLLLYGFRGKDLIIILRNHAFLELLLFSCSCLTVVTSSLHAFLLF